MKKKTNKPSGNITHEFPKNSRFIPEKELLLASFTTPVGLFYFIGYLVIGLAILIMGYKLVKDVKEGNALQFEKNKISAELSFWKLVTRQYPNYRDGYFHVALLEYQLGDKAGALQNVEKTLQIDPNFQKGRDLELILQK